MTRDFAKKKRAPARRAKPKNQVPGWVWLFTGAALGGFIVFLVHLADIEPPAREPGDSPGIAQALPEPETPEPNASPKPRFDFYKLLRESEVVVPATEPSSPDDALTVEPSVGPGTDAPGAAEPAPSQTAASGEEFVLQVGSFRRQTEADNLRARLLLLNLDAFTEQVTIRDNETWHRVMVGPFHNQSRLSSARSTLVSNDYNALVLRRQPD